MNNFVRSAEGAVINRSSGDGGSLQVPATVTVPKGSYGVSFVATTTYTNSILTYGTDPNGGHSDGNA